jgi:hypothetical protein
MNRRDFLKGAGAIAVPAAVLGPALLPLVTPARHGAARDPAAVSVVVYDERYVACRTFAEALAGSGAAPFPLTGDSARLWYGPLGAHLSHDPGRVAGMGTYADFGVSVSCARERDLGLVFEGTHDARNAPRLVHRFRASGAQRQVAEALSCSRISWPESLADALLRIPSRGESAGLVDFTAISPAATSPSSNHPGYLVSWLLVPANA